MHVTAVISTTDMITFTTHLHTVPHGPRCSKNAPSFPSLLPTVRVIARNLAVFSNVTLTKNLYGIRKSGHFTYSWYNNYYSRSCVFFIADMLQILAAVKTSRSPCVVKILQYIFFIFFSLLFCMAERGNAED